MNRNKEELLLKAEKFIEKHQYVEAEKILIDILQNIDSEYIDAANNLVVVWILLEKFEAALDMINQILLKYPNDEIAISNLNYLNTKFNNDSENQIQFSAKTKTAASEVSIIIPVFNKIELTEKCLRSLNKINSKNKFEVIVVDNNSTDGTFERLNEIRKILNYDLKILKNEENFGFAKGNNLGVKKAKYENLLFLNNDTIAEMDFLSKPIQLLNSEKIGAVGIKLLYPDGLIQHAGLAFGNDKLATHIFNFYSSDYPPANKSREISAITGACFFIKKELFNNLKGFDEIFINGQEDIDLCLKIKNAGYKIWYTPEAWLYHLESQSANRLEKAFQNRSVFLNRWENIVESDIENYYKNAQDYFAIKSQKSKYELPNKLNFAIKIGVPNREHKN